MKKILFLTIISLLGIGAFYGYKYFFQPEIIDTWSLVPEKAIAVYESDQFGKTWSELEGKKVWKTASLIPEIQQLKENLASFNGTTEKRDLVQLLTKDSKLLIALFPISKSALGSLYILEVNSIEQHAGLAGILEKNYRQKSRKYNGFTISEVTNKTTGKQFSFVFYRNYFIGSNTPFLVEDAIRTIKETDYRSFKEQQQELFQLVRLQKDDGNLYINSSAFKDLISLFYEGTKAEISQFSNMASSSFLDITTTNDRIQLNGFSLVRKEQDFLNIFRDNQASSLQITNLVSNDAMGLAHYSFRNPTLFLSNLLAYRKRYEKSYTDQQAILNRHDVDIESFSQWLGGEMGLYHTNNGNGKVMIMSTSDVVIANQQLKEISKRVAQVKGDTVYSEVYDGNEITFFPLAEFPSLILGETAKGFPEVFYLNLGDKLVFSNELQVLKDLLEDVKNENTWGKSLKFNQFFEDLDKESNLSYLINVRNSWQYFISQLNSEWRHFFEQNEAIVKEFELIGIQFSNVDNNYFTNINMSHPGKFQERRGSAVLQPEVSVTFDYGLSRKPKIVRNHVDNSREIILQDSANRVYLLSRNFDILWIDSLDNPITTDLYQVDYFKNGKLQYLFGTEGTINLLDRNGEKVAKYPIKVSELPITTLNVVDYNKNKKYRWALSDESGNLFLLDKKGTKLKNWNPNQKKYKLDRKIKHTRVLGKDLIMISLEKGIYDVISRQGNSYPGFPINFDKDIDPQYILKPGSSFSRSTSTFITRDGEIITVNLRGKFLKREQLVEGSKNAQYGFIKDLNSNKYLISVVDRKKVIILDQNGKSKFEKEYLNNGDLLLQYYHFGVENELVIMTDLQQDYTYLYDGKGNLINSVPIENNRAVSILYSKRRKEFEMFSNYRNRLDKFVFKQE